MEIILNFFYTAPDGLTICQGFGNVFFSMLRGTIDGLNTKLEIIMGKTTSFSDLFCFGHPSLVGLFFYAPTGVRAIFLHITTYKL